MTLVACLGIVQFTIFGANLIVSPGALWMILAFREGERPDVPAFFWPPLALAAWTLVELRVLDRPDRELHAVATAPAVPDRAGDRAIAARASAP